MGKMIRTGVLGVALLLGGTVASSAREPERDVSFHRHPNLAAAQRAITTAFEKIEVAQRRNEWDMEGHAQKAKELLEQANAEIKLAAEAANHNRER
jgi:hypothetical protein